jgi:hypothetical protein
VNDLLKQPDTRTPSQGSGEPRDSTGSKTAEVIEIEEDDSINQSSVPEGPGDKESVVEKPETAAEELSMTKIPYIIRNTHPVIYKAPLENLDLTCLYIFPPITTYLTWLMVIMFTFSNVLPSIVREKMAAGSKDSWTPLIAS